jgi:mRNA-degrading endonuclease toxin of MazEF toxin-antitoxin module
MTPRPASNIGIRTTSAVAGVVRRVETSRIGQRVGRRVSWGADPRPRDFSIRRVSFAEISISYEPLPDGKPDPGEVIWVWIPYEEDPTVGKDRPAVAVGWVPSTPEDDVAVVPLTSKWRSGQVSVGLGSWDGGRKRSYAKVDQLYVVNRNDVRREGSSLPKPVFDTVVRALGAG